MIADHIRRKLSLLSSSEECNLIRTNWSKALQNEQNLILVMLQRLEDWGLDVMLIEKIIDHLIAFGLNINDTWSASYILYDMVNSMSLKMLGTETNTYAPLLEYVEIDVSFPAPDVSEDLGSAVFHRKITSLDEMNSAYQVLLERCRNLVLSANSYEEISKRVLEDSNLLVKRSLEFFLPMAWQNLRIPLDSPCVVFFRDIKSYGSDLDLFYWGPQSQAVILELTRYYLLLGIKMDLYSISINNLILENYPEISHPFFDMYLYLYFFMGTCIELNGASFDECYNRCVANIGSLEDLWNSSHRAISQVLGQVNAIRHNWSERRRDLKSLYFRTISILLFGFSVKYNIRFTLGLDTFLRQLSKHLDSEEIEFIRDSCFFINQARSLLNVFSGTRWESAYSGPYKKATGILQTQGVDSPDEKLDRIGFELERLLKKYFPELANMQPLMDQPLEQEPFEVGIPQKELFFMKVWDRVAEIYLQIIVRNQEAHGKVQ